VQCGQRMTCGSKAKKGALSESQSAFLFTLDSIL